MYKSYIQKVLILLSRIATPPTAATKETWSIPNTKQAPKTSAGHSSTAQMDAPHARCCLQMLLGGSVLALCLLRVSCTDGCVHEKVKNRPDVHAYFFGLHQNLTYVK